jgi:hypothetical protein
MKKAILSVLSVLMLTAPAMAIPTAKSSTQDVEIVTRNKQKEERATQEEALVHKLNRLGSSLQIGMDLSEYTAVLRGLNGDIDDLKRSYSDMSPGIEVVFNHYRVAHEYWQCKNDFFADMGKPMDFGVWAVKMCEGEALVEKYGLKPVDVGIHAGDEYHVSSLTFHRPAYGEPLGYISTKKVLQAIWAEAQAQLNKATNNK